MNSDRLVLVCQAKTCLKDGAGAVLAALEQQAPAHIKVQSTGCTGECGNGPIVIVLPEEVWYSHVQPKVVPVIVRQHLRDGQPVPALLYGKYHPAQLSPEPPEIPEILARTGIPWILIASLCLLSLGMLVWVILSHG
jgi:(2Fe-2S) ferredoxin